MFLEDQLGIFIRVNTPFLLLRSIEPRLDRRVPPAQEPEGPGADVHPPEADEA